MRVRTSFTVAVMALATMPTLGDNRQIRGASSATKPEGKRDLRKKMMKGRPVGKNGGSGDYDVESYFESDIVVTLFGAQDEIVNSEFDLLEMGFKESYNQVASQLSDPKRREVVAAVIERGNVSRRRIQIRQSAFNAFTFRYVVSGQCRNCNRNSNLFNQGVRRLLMWSSETFDTTDFDTREELPLQLRMMEDADPEERISDAKSVEYRDTPGKQQNDWLSRWPYPSRENGRESDSVQTPAADWNQATRPTKSGYSKRPLLTPGTPLDTGAGKVRAPTADEFTFAYNRTVVALAASGDLVSVSEVLGSVEVDRISCPAEIGQIESTVAVEFGIDSDTVSDAELRALESSFVDSYGDVASTVCDPLFRSVSEAIIESDVMDGRRLATSRVRYRFTVSGSCRGCSSGTKLYNYGVRRLVSTMTYMYDRELQFTATDDSCFCPVGAESTGPTTDAFTAAYNSNIQILRSAGVLQSVTTVESTTELGNTTVAPTMSPTFSPSTLPPIPLAAPIAEVTQSPTFSPTFSPSTLAPTAVPTFSPTITPSTSEPTTSPTSTPTFGPTTSAPTAVPTFSPTFTPSTSVPTTFPTSIPTTSSPTGLPTASPTFVPTTSALTALPTATPTFIPTTTAPTAVPTATPSTTPPSPVPTVLPTSAPTVTPPNPKPPTSTPSITPTSTPTTLPTYLPTIAPTTFEPSLSPTYLPTIAPTTSAPIPLATPPPTRSVRPSSNPSSAPTESPVPSPSPSEAPTQNTLLPTVFKEVDDMVTKAPTFIPTESPSDRSLPSSTQSPTESPAPSPSPSEAPTLRAS